MLLWLSLLLSPISRSISTGNLSPSSKTLSISYLPGSLPNLCHSLDKILSTLHSVYFRYSIDLNMINNHERFRWQTLCRMPSSIWWSFLLFTIYPIIAIIIIIITINSICVKHPMQVAANLTTYNLLLTLSSTTALPTFLHSTSTTKNVSFLVHPINHSDDTLANRSALGSTQPIHLSHSALGIFLSLFCFITVFGNGLVIYAIIQERYLKSGLLSYYFCLKVEVVLSIFVKISGVSFIRLMRVFFSSSSKNGEKTKQERKWLIESREFPFVLLDTKIKIECHSIYLIKAMDNPIVVAVNLFRSRIPSGIDGTSRAVVSDRFSSSMFIVLENIVHCLLAMSPGFFLLEKQWTSLIRSLFLSVLRSCQ